MGGCCEANKVLKFNNRNELLMRNAIQSEARAEDRPKEIISKPISNLEILSKKENDSMHSHVRDFDTEIPQIKEMRIPSMKIPIDIIQTKLHLDLIILESKYLPEGRILCINPGGLVGSERNAQDGVTIFGVTNVNNFKFIHYLLVRLFK